MDALSGVNERIWQIQSQLARLSARTAPAATSFDTVLGEAVLGQVTRSTPSPAVASPGARPAPGLTLVPAIGAPDLVGTGADAVDAKGVPHELRPYGNGRIPASALSTVAGTQHALWEPAARSLEALRAAASRDGVTIGITDSYRSYESQVDVAARKGLYSQGGLAAVPGTSNHGWGIAVDLKLDAAAQAWMRSNGARFGFVENVPREPWHWEYRPR